MRPAELRGMSDQELVSAMQDRVREVFNLRFRSQSQKLDSPAELQKARKEIARIQTILRQRQIEAQKG